MKFIIEHLEPTLSDWCFIEYNHISKIAGLEGIEHTIELPYRYLLENREPVLAEDLANYLVRKEEV